MPAAHQLALGSGNVAYAPIYSRIFQRLDNTYLTESAASLAYNPAGTKLAAARSSSPYFRLLDGETLASESGLPALPGVVRDFAWSPDGTRLAIAHENSKRWSLLDVAAKSLITVSRDYTGWAINGIAYSPDGTKIAVSGFDFGKLEILNAADGTLLQTLTNRSGGIGQGCAWSPDGSMVVQGHNASPGMTVWETTGWTQVAAAPSLGTTATRMSWSPDGAYIAFCLAASPWFRVVRVSDWSIVSGTFAPGIATQDVAYSPLGEIALAYNAAPYSRVLSADGTTTTWTPSPLMVAPTRVAWSPAAALKSIGGTVVDDNDAPIVRELLLMHGATKAIVGSTTSAADGSYSIDTPYSDGHTVLLVESTGRVQALGGGLIPL